MELPLDDDLLRFERRDPLFNVLVKSGYFGFQAFYPGLEISETPLDALKTGTSFLAVRRYVTRDGIDLLIHRTKPCVHHTKPCVHRAALSC